MEYVKQSYGSSRQSSCQCPVSANAIANQLVKNGKYKCANRETYRLVMEELSEFWTATAPDAVNTSRDFSPEEFASALYHLKPGKAPDPD